VEQDRMMLGSSLLTIGNAQVALAELESFRFQLGSEFLVPQQQGCL
jgi:hypothetical protein